MRFTRITAFLAATAIAVAPVATTAQMTQTPPPAATWEDREGRMPAATIAGVVLAVLILGVAINAIGRTSPRAIPPAPPPPVSP